MYHVSAQGVDEHMINVHYYYYDGTPHAHFQGKPLCQVTEHLNKSKTVKK